ncbi:hypothetical protein [Gracilimonas tropica]|uniref:hypothetical protein n=1 Tax=Gracilimonas tropica TaxID=454600 RepID=UPI0003613D28|nr:hypothetical protein [Gracilimonas tropica]
MAEEKELTEFMAGDKVKIPAPKKKNTPVRIGGVKDESFYAAYFNGHEGAIQYGRVYQVSGKDEVKVVDNKHTPVPYIAKEFVNHPRFNGLFKAVETRDNNQKKED